MTEYAICEIKCSYSDYTKISSKLSSVGAAEEDSDFAAEVLMRVSCLASDHTKLNDLVVQTTNGKSEARLIGLEERPEQ